MVLIKLPDNTVWIKLFQLAE